MTDQPLRSRTGLFEIVGRAALMTLMALIAAGLFHRMNDIAAGPEDGLVRTLDFLGTLGAFVFAALVCLLAMTRLVPVATAGGWVPVAAALGGAFLLTAVNYLPAVPVPLAAKVLGVGLLAVGNGGAIYCLAHLGRSFSVLPQARRLVSSGPYGLVRHPLYVAEAIATLGMIVPHLGWAAVSLCLIWLALQRLRIHHEEAVLSRAFPGYADYARRVPRFVPRVRFAAPGRVRAAH